MIPKRAYHVRVGLAVAVVASSLAWGAFASTASDAAPAPQSAALNIQPQAAGAGDDTYYPIGRIYVDDTTGGKDANPASVAINAIDDTVYVANAWTGTVEAIAPGQTSGTPYASVSVIPPTAGQSKDIGLYGIAVDSNDDTVYVVNRGLNPKRLWAINGRTMTVDDTVTFSCDGDGHDTAAYRYIAVNSLDDTVYVPCDADGLDTRGRLYAVNGRNLDDSISVTSGSSLVYGGMYVDEATNRVFSGTWWSGAGTVQVRNGADLSSLPTTFSSGFDEPTSITKVDDTVYVTSFLTSQLLARNIASGTSNTVALRAGLTDWQAVAAFRDDSLIFVGSTDPNTTPYLTVLNTPGLTVSSEAYQVAISSLAVSSSGLVYAGQNFADGYTYRGVNVYGQRPDAPTGVSGTPGIQQASVSWTAPVDYGTSPLLEYKVTASPGGASCTATPPATSCTVMGLTGGTAYTFTVEARNAAGWSSPSSASLAVTPTAPPGAPTGATATAGVQAASVSWIEPINKGFPATLTSYRVTANPGGSQCTATPPATSCTVSPLTAGTAYTFTVEAQNATGWGPSSAASNSVTPSAPPPPPPPSPIANMQLTMSSSPARFEKAGDVLAITATVLNNGTDALNTVQIEQGGIPLTCTPSTPVATLASGSSVVCRGTYTVTEEDIDSGFVRDRVTARATAGQSGSPLTAAATLEVQGPPPPEKLQLQVVMNSTPPTFGRVGERLTLSALVTNTGNVPVTDVVITGSPADLTCVPNSPVRSLATKSSMRCSGTYQVTRADMSSGVLRGLTRATGVSTRGTRIASTGAVEVPRTSPEKASLKVTMSSTPESFRRAGQTLTLKAIATNRGDVPLTNVTVTGTPGRFTCKPRTPVANLEVDAKVTCTAKYDVSAADVRAGVIRATVKASGISAKGAATSDDVVIRIKEASPPRGRSMSYLVPRLVW